MGNFSIGGAKYRYLPNSSLCIVLADFPSRRRVRIRLDNGQELDEVAYHDMTSLEASALPPEAPSPAPTPEVSSEAVRELQAGDTEGQEEQPRAYPFRDRMPWNRREEAAPPPDDEEDV